MEDAPMGAAAKAAMMLIETRRRDYAAEPSMTIAVGTLLLFLNVLVFTALYYMKDKRRHEMHRWQHTQHVVHMQHGDGDVTAAGDIRMACPPNYALMLRNASDDIPRVAPSTTTVMGTAMGGSSGALHTFNAFAGGGSSGNVHNLPHGHSTMRV